MKASQLADSLLPLASVAKVSPGSSVIACREGKLQYLGRSSYVQVDNEVSHALSDFFLRVSDVRRWLSWLAWHESKDVTAVTKGNSIALSCSGSAISLGVPGVGMGKEYFEPLEEIVLQNIVSNDYFFTINSEEWFYRVNSMKAISDEKDSNYHMTKITVTDDTAVLTMGTQHGMVKETFQLGEHASPSSPFVANVAFESLGLNLADYDDETDLKISYSENTTKVLSPLMVEYKNGVTQVLAVAWQ